jgi:hypothetical protein
LNLSSRQQK